MTEEIYEEAPTSDSNKKCAIKKDYSGCEEIVDNSKNIGTFGLENKKIMFNLLLVIYGLLF